MAHLTNDNFRRLAKLVTQDLAFTADDVLNMEHIGECEECFRKLRRYMTVLEAVDDIAAYAERRTQKNIAVSPSEGTKAVIKVVIFNAFAILEQLQTQRTTWEFDAPLGVSTRSSVQDDSSVHKLEDIDNSKNFIAYDPGRKILVIQIEYRSGDHLPCAHIKMPDGEMRKVSFEKREDFLWAEIHDLNEGEYEVVLDK